MLKYATDRASQTGIPKLQACVVRHNTLHLSAIVLRPAYQVPLRRVVQPNPCWFLADKHPWRLSNEKTWPKDLAAWEPGKIVPYALAMNGPFWLLWWQHNAILEILVSRWNTLERRDQNTQLWRCLLRMILLQGAATLATIAICGECSENLHWRLSQRPLLSLNL
jgi:hypothetical protein